MPRYQIFNNRTVLEPGSYTQTRGGDKKAPDAISSGKVMIIDTGSGAGYGGGSGSLGTQFNGKKSIYSFRELDDFRNWIRGGNLWDIAGRIFKPSTEDGTRGCDELMILQAKNSTPSTAVLQFGTIVSTVITNGGKLTLKTNAEGVGANGTITSSKLSSGFGFKVSNAGGLSLKISFYVGTYKGLDYNSQPINNETLDAASSNPTLLFETKPFLNFNDLLAELRSSGDFQEEFYVDEVNTQSFGTGIHGGINDTTTVLTAFIGATESYDTAAYDEAIASIQEVDNTFFLCDQFGVDDGVDVENTKLITAITNEGTYDRFMVVGGGKDSTQRTQSNDSSLAMAQYFNSARVYVCHGDILEKNKTKPGFRRLNTLYFAATVAGKLAGNAPQDPITWKSLDIDGVVDDLKLKEREALLKGGVIHIREISDSDFVVNQEVNTLQTNDNEIYPSGFSPEGSVMRIAAILNKEIKIKTQKRFVGSNYNTSDPADVKSYVETILTDKTANKLTDNLIISFRDIVVTLLQTDYTVQYGYVVNGPINRLFITGFVFSPGTTN